MYRTLEELWNMYARGGMRNAAAFVPIFRMGLRLLIDTAAMERCGGLDRYVGEYAGEAKSCRGLRVLKGSAAGPASPSAPPISADCRVDGMPRPAGSPAVA